MLPHQCTLPHGLTPFPPKRFMNSSLHGLQRAYSHTCLQHTSSHSMCLWRPKPAPLARSAAGHVPPGLGLPASALSGTYFPQGRQASFSLSSHNRIFHINRFHFSLPQWRGSFLYCMSRWQVTGEFQVYVPPPRVVCGPGTARDNICCTYTVITDPARLAEHLRRTCESEPKKKHYLGRPLNMTADVAGELRGGGGGIHCPSVCLVHTLECQFSQHAFATRPAGLHCTGPAILHPQQAVNAVH